MKRHTIIASPTKVDDGSFGEEPMEDPEDDHVELSEEELFTRLTDALVEDAPFSTSTSAPAPRTKLERRVRSLTFERN